MARGWESKSVEDQQAEAMRPKDHLPQSLTPEQAARARQRATLELSRKRAVEQLAHASNPLQRNMLENAIRDLDHRIVELQ
jgi:hypothetical protein